MRSSLGDDFDWVDDVENFREKFEALHLYENFRLRESLKIHILKEHLDDFFFLTGETMATTNDELV